MTATCFYGVVATYALWKIRTWHIQKLFSVFVLGHRTDVVLSEGAIPIAGDEVVKCIAWRLRQHPLL